MAKAATAKATTAPAITRQVQIPTIGDEMILAEPWTFRLYDEGRNHGLFEFLGEWVEEEINSPWRRHTCGWHGTSGKVSCTPENCPMVPHTYTVGKPASPLLDVTLPAGAVLVVDRIYLRKGAAEFDSITFLWHTGVTKELRASRWNSAKQKKKVVRFWVKLHDVNKMVVRSDEWTLRDAADAEALKAEKATKTRQIELD